MQRFFSDSLSAIYNIKNAYTANNINVQVQHLLQYAKKNGNIIKLCWIPGHYNIKENEMVDQTAKNVVIDPSSITIPVITKLYETSKCNAMTCSIDISRKFEVIFTRFRIDQAQIFHCHLLEKDDSQYARLVELILQSNT